MKFNGCLQFTVSLKDKAMQSCTMWQCSQTRIGTGQLNQILKHRTADSADTLLQEVTTQADTEHRYNLETTVRRNSERIFNWRLPCTFKMTYHAFET